MNEDEFKKISLEDLGYVPFFATKRNKLGLDSFPVARVVSELKEAYRVRNTEGEYLAKITGKHIFKATSREDYPAVGDWVVIEVVDNNQAVIRGILSRRTIIKRKYEDKIQVIATNIDVVFIVESVDSDYSLNRFERYFAIAENGGVKPAIVLNKTDLFSKEALEEKKSELKVRFPDIDIIFTSTINNQGLDALKKYIVKGKTYCFLGSSGVGKSTLINTLLGESFIKTGDINSYTGRGKHVTTSRQMYFLSTGADGENGGIVIDNPGMREVGVADVGDSLDTAFNEITILAAKCKYKDCTHIHEPGCEVLLAVNSHKLDKEKYSNFLKLKKEAKYSQLSRPEKKEKKRKFGKFIKKAKDDLKRYGHKGSY